MEPCSPASLQTVDTQLYADSVEWCPFDGLQHILLCGTYQLLETSPPSQPHGQPQVRVGQLQVYQLDVGHSAQSLSHGDPAQSLSHGDPAQSLSHGDPAQSLPHGDPAQSLSHGDLAQSLSHGDPAQSLSHGDPTLSLSHCLDMPGILDIKWARQRLGTAALYGLVNAKGQLQLWALEDEGSVMGAGGSVMGAEGSVMGAGGSVMGAGGSMMGAEGSMMGVEERSGRGPVVPRPVKTVEIAECIGLSLDWAASGEGSIPRIVTSDSTGGLSLFEVTSDVTMTSQWHAHDFEAWICAFDQWNADVIYSGGDDCKLKVWDLRSGTTPVTTNSRFTMGVCSVQGSPHTEHLLAVGSYDENLRLFDTRQMRRPVSTSPLGGGVWRVKWEPLSGHSLLTATMHNGFHILDCSTPDVEPLPVRAHYTCHSSLAYGADWCRLHFHPAPAADTEGPHSQPHPTPATDTEGPDSQPHSAPATDTEGPDSARQTASQLGALTHRLLASCSFYDHSLQLWRCSV